MIYWSILHAKILIHYGESIMVKLDESALLKLIEITERKLFFKEIANSLKRKSKEMDANFAFIGDEKSYEIPVLYKEQSAENAPVLIFIGAQHNEFNGTFGVFDFLDKNIDLLSKWIKKTRGGFCFIPIFNKQGFLHPRRENKWGYYIFKKNLDKANLNRFWKYTLDLENSKSYHKSQPPIHKHFKAFLVESFRKPLYFFDFHETSLLYKKIRKVMDYQGGKLPKTNHWMDDWITKTALQYKDFHPDINRDKMDTKAIQKSLRSMFSQMEQQSFYFIEFTKNIEELAMHIDKKLELEFQDVLIPGHKRSMQNLYDIDGSVLQAARHIDGIYVLEFEMRKLIFDLKRTRARLKKEADHEKHVLKLMVMNRDMVSCIITQAFSYFSQHGKT